MADHKRDGGKAGGAGVAAATGVATKPARARRAKVGAVYDDLEACVREVASTKRLPSAKRGLAAEHAHAKTFSANAIAEGRADLAAEVHMPGDRRVDVRVTRKGAVVSAAQLKYSESGQVSGLRLARAQYDGVEQLVVPAGQVRAAKAALGERAKRNSKSSVDRRRALGDVQRRAAARIDDRIRHDGVASAALTAADADALAAGDTGLVRKARKRASRRTAKEVGVAGAAAGGIASAAAHAPKVLRREESFSAAAWEALKEAAANALRSVILDVIESRATAALMRVAPRLAKGMARTNATMALLSCAWSICAKWLRGEATLGKSAGELVSTAGAFAMAEALAFLGMAFGPMGGMVGGMLGGFIGSVCGDRFASRAGLA